MATDSAFAEDVLDAPDAPLERNTMKFRTAAVPTALAAMLLLAACGSGGSTDNAGSTGNAEGFGPGGGMQTALADYVACMKDNGVTLTLPSGGPGNGGTPPSGAPGEGMGTPPSGAPGDGAGTPPSGGPDGAAPSGAPNGGGGLGFLQKPDDVDQKTWNTATKACSSELPSMGARSDASGAAPQPSASG